MASVPPEEQLAGAGFLIREEDHTLPLRGGPTRGPRGSKVLKRRGRGGSLEMLTLPAMKTNTWWQVGSQRINHRIVRITIYVHSHNNTSLSLSFITFAIKGLD